MLNLLYVTTQMVSDITLLLLLLLQCEGRCYPETGCNGLLTILWTDNSRSNKQKKSQSFSPKDRNKNILLLGEKKTIKLTNVEFPAEGRWRRPSNQSVSVFIFFRGLHHRWIRRRVNTNQGRQMGWQLSTPFFPEWLNSVSSVETHWQVEPVRGKPSRPSERRIVSRAAKSPSGSPFFLVHYSSFQDTLMSFSITFHSTWLPHILQIGSSAVQRR